MTWEFCAGLAGSHFPLFLRDDMGNFDKNLGTAILVFPPILNTALLFSRVGWGTRVVNVQKWSEHVAFGPFWLGNVLRATTACISSTSHRSKVARSFRVFTMLTWKGASRHNAVRF